MSTSDAIVDEIRAEIEDQPDDLKIRVMSIAMTLRNILKADPTAASMALALVGAEEAAKP